VEEGCEGDQSGCEEEGREEVADGDLLDVQQAQAEGQEDHAAGGREGVDLGGGQDVAGEVADDGPAALDQRDRRRGGEDAPAEGGGEGHGGEAVEDRLDVELVGPEAEAVGDRAEDGERADAEQQRRGDQVANCSSRYSSCSQVPSTAPTSSAASTTIIADDPTSPFSASEFIATTDSPPMTMVNRPRTDVTVSFVRSGIRLPSAMPSSAPTTTVATFTIVPIPIITDRSNQTQRPEAPWGGTWTAP
jgi:hypothetical protein